MREGRQEGGGKKGMSEGEEVGKGVREKRHWGCGGKKVWKEGASVGWFSVNANIPDRNSNFLTVNIPPFLESPGQFLLQFSVIPESFLINSPHKI